MKKSGKPAIVRLVLAASLVAGGVTIEGCGGGDPGPNEVFMQRNAFNPMEITIQAGESVTWTNQDLIVPHTATSGNPGDEDLGAIFRSALLGQGDTFTHTFEDAGEFVYFCEVYLDRMRDAKVIVTSGN